MENQIAVFEQNQIRRIEHEGEIYFSVVDIIGVLTDSPTPRNYWAKIKKSITEESQLLPFWKQLTLTAADGKKRLTDCANTEGVLRIIQSVPSPKAEPFKIWLAGLGKQAIEEISDLELGYERLHALYQAKGYSDKWIKERLQTITTRRELTDEWQKRGIEDNKDYSILTATIAKGTFGLTPSEHAELKGLNKENLRDHMTSMELIFTSLSEEVTRTLTINHDAQGFNENHDVAVKGGEAARKARLNIEQVTGQKVVSTKNYLTASESDNTDTLPTTPPPAQ